LVRGDGMTPLIRLAALLMLDYHLYILLDSGKISLYINPRFLPLTWFAFIFINLLILLVLWDAFKLFGRPKLIWSLHGAPFIVLAAVMTLFVSPPQAFDNSMVGQKGLVLIQKKTAPAARPNANTISRDDSQGTNEPIHLTTDNFIMMFAKMQHRPLEYDGRDLEMEGFIVRHPLIGPDSFLIARYAVICCAADAEVLGFEADGQVPYADGSWVHLRGKLYYSEGKLKICAVKAEKRPVPDNPYVYAPEGLPELK